MIAITKYKFSHFNKNFYSNNCKNNWDKSIKVTKKKTGKYLTIKEITVHFREFSVFVVFFFCTSYFGKISYGIFKEIIEVNLKRIKAHGRPKALGLTSTLRVKNSFNL